jgi:hypothetical protein
MIILLNTNCGIVSPTLNVNPTLFVIPCKIFRRIIDLQDCNYCYLPSDFSSKFLSSMTIFHHKLLTSGGRALANGYHHPSSFMRVFVHLFIRSVIQKVMPTYDIGVTSHNITKKWGFLFSFLVLSTLSMLYNV